MDQILETFGIDWRLVTIQIVNFSLVLIILTKFVYRPVMRMVDERRAEIARGIEAAREAEAARTSAEGEAEKRRRDAIAEAGRLIDDGKRHATAESDAIREAAEAARRKLIAEGEAEKSALRDSALREAQTEIARLAVLGAERVLRERSA